MEVTLHKHFFGAALLMALVGAAWTLFSDGEPSSAAATAKLVADPIASAGQDAPATTTTQEPTAGPTATTLLTQTESAAEARVWDLCGVGLLPIPNGMPDLASGGWAKLPAHLGEAAQDSGRERLLQAMSQGDARARGAALVLGLGYAQRIARLASEPKSVSDALAQTQQALLGLAQSSRDPVVASWATLIKSTAHLP